MPTPDVTFATDRSSVTAHVADDLPAAGHRILTEAGFTRPHPGSPYTLSSPDAHRDAARATYLLRAGGLTISHAHGSPAPQAGPAVPDVAFGRHPEHGIVAATDTDDTLGLVPDTLRRFGFRHHPEREIYLPPRSDDEGLRAAAQATRALQALGYAVAAAPGLTMAPPAMQAVAEAADTLTAERDNLAELADTRDAADVLDAALDEQTGALPQLGRLLEEVAAWCRALPPELRTEVEEPLEDLSFDVARLRTDLGQVQHALARMSTVVAVHRPAGPVRTQAARTSVRHTGLILHSPAPAAVSGGPA
uniref:hypothetical protein n=1 Tax=Peterkaempfera griseoplana TaxID=66896 RepID=UPI0006E2A189